MDKPEKLATEGTQCK